jgi:dTDP-3-amino-2,3,6-trideoxy-4-keto-D-glucose/dTDP-3-amino-3,4,6-trideoxy-alpha-D-glucose/dTDP-2,6-dideoxy-D-kanosamine transaminase
MVNRISVVDLSKKVQKRREVIDGAISRVLDSGRFILDSEVAGFETKFAKYIGAGYCLGVANGSDAIELALRSSGITTNSIVGTVANAGNYSSGAISRIGATPHYIDIELRTRNLSIELIRETFEKIRIDALIVTHLYGLLVENMKEIRILCDYHNVVLIEDCAQATGARYGNSAAGSFGHIATFSFYPTKNLGALGDGGAIVTDNPKFHATARSLRTYGWEGKYVVEIPNGSNSRLDEIQAAILSDLLPFLDEDNSRRREIATRYCTEIRNPLITLPHFSQSEYVAHLFVVEVENRASIMHQLSELGIGTDIHYPIPDHLQKNAHVSHGLQLVNTEYLAQRVLTLPCYPEMSDEMVSTVIRALNNIE